MNRKTMPKKSQIADYWKDKKLPNGYPVIIDWYEPSCWACGQWWNNEDEGELIEQGKFNELWNHPNYNLERCHIIPKALGGSNNVDNLFLMCPTCHKNSPDTTNVELFFDWVMKRTMSDMHNESWISELFKELRDRNINIEKFYNWYMDDKTRIYSAQENMNTHGFKIVNSTLVNGYIGHYLDNNEVVCV